MNWILFKSSSNQYYNRSFIVNSWVHQYDNIDDEPYVYPTVDYGKDTRTGEFDYWDSSHDFDNYLPSLWVKSVIDGVFNGFRYDETKQTYTQLYPDNTPIKKYKYSSEFFNQNWFKKMILLNNADRLETSVMTYVAIAGGSLSGLDTDYFRTYKKDNGNFNPNDNATYQTNVPFLETKTKMKTSIKISINMNFSGSGEYVVGLCNVTSNNNQHHLAEENMVVKHKFNKTSCHKFRLHG